MRDCVRTDCVIPPLLTLEFEQILSRGLEVLVGVDGADGNVTSGDMEDGYARDDLARAGRGLPDVVRIRGVLLGRRLLVRAVGDVSGVELLGPWFGVKLGDVHGRAETLPRGEVCKALVLAMGEVGPLGRPRGASGG